MVQPLWRTAQPFLTKLNLHLPHKPAIALLLTQKLAREFLEQLYSLYSNAKTTEMLIRNHRKINIGKF